MRYSKSNFASKNIIARREVAATTSLSVFNRVGLLLVVSLLIVSTLGASLFSATTASAKASDSPETQASDFAYYQALRKCINVGEYKNAGGVAGRDTMSQQNAVDFDWFNGKVIVSIILGQTTDNSTNVGAFQDPRGVNGDGRQNCGDSEGRAWIAKVAAQWGYASGPAMLCDLGFTRQTNSVACTEVVSGANNDFRVPNGGAVSKLDELYTKKLGYKSTDVSSIQDTGGLYAMFLASFKSQCKLSPNGNDYSIQEWDTAKKDWVTKTYGAADRDRGKDYSVDLYEGNNKVTCGKLAEGLNDKNLMRGYKDYYLTSDTTPPETQLPGSTNGSATTSSCVIEGIGWIVCPITNFLSGVADSSFAVISNFLQVNVKLFDSNSGTYTAWTSFRNIANVAFVIVFLIIIFSQLTGQGVSNYGVKKTLPRLVIAAILVNLSFIVCQFAVDITQIIGASLKDLLLNIPVGTGNAKPVSSWTSVMGDVLSGAVVASLAIAGLGIGVATVALSISGPVLLAAVIAILMTVVILIGRQAAIVILIVISPLAFVAFLLPNTEQWFKRWYKMFLALLMVYPIIALLYGGGQLASKIISSAANADGVADDVQFWLSITAIGVASIPLIMTPSLLKGALSGVGSIGAKLSGFAAKANGDIKKSAMSSSRVGEAKTGLKNRFALSRARRRVDGESRLGRVQQSIDRSAVGRALGLDRGASRALATVQEEESKDLKLSQFSLSDEVAEWKATDPTSVDTRLKERALDKKRPASDRAAAMHTLASLGRDKAIRELRSDSRYDKDDEISMQHAISSNAGSLLGKAPDLVKGASPAFGNITGEQLAGFSDDTAKAHTEHLRKLYSAASAPGASKADVDQFNKAYSSFSSAIQDIRSNPTLQAKFAGDTGKAYASAFADLSNPAGFNGYTPTGIGPDGKIR